MRIPVSTYRLQFNSGFTFKDAQNQLEYLKKLGITDIYASPVFKCKKGSSHGYDVTDPNSINTEAGTADDFYSLTKLAASLDLGWIQDIVPNHMSFSSQNMLIEDIMENGPSFEFKDFFDVNWDYPYEGIKGRLLAPFLGSPYVDALESGEIKITLEERGFYVNYYENSFPLRIESYPDILSLNIDLLKNSVEADNLGYLAFADVINSMKSPPYQSYAARKEHTVFIKKTLWNIYTAYPEIRKHMNANIVTINGEKGNPESFLTLDRILLSQFYKLCYWKSGSDEINYRRFFNVNDLISLKQERDEVFEYTHKLIFELLKNNVITGLRVDHIDGLFNPKNYLFKLRKNAADAYIVVEKILGFNEKLSHFWPVQGSTGYDFMNYVNELFCEKKNSDKFDRIYRKFSGINAEYREIMLNKKRLIIGNRMAGDVENLARTLKEASGSDRHGSDMTMYALKRALVEILALFPIYRTYIEPDVFIEQDKKYITNALEASLISLPEYEKEIEFIGKFLLLKFPKYITDEKEKQKWVNFVMQFQQLTGPLMAKGFEDTFFYVFNRLISLNEVGGFPELFGIEAPEFHKHCSEKAETFPAALNATSTHDTKRGEDTRARINVLSEIPEEWETHLNKWKRINSKISTGIDSNDEYFLYQTILGSWPENSEIITREYTERIKNYMVKALREAKVHTAWIKPNHAYEDKCMEFVNKLLSGNEKNDFIENFLPFQKKIAFFGMFNSLSQLLLKITAPGVPDFYQGSEFWDLTLVDPDNRRPVDYAGRNQTLDKIIEMESDKQKTINDLLLSWQDGRIKMFVMRALLKTRFLNRELFEKGNYTSAILDGTHMNNIIAFVRRSGLNISITVVPRFLTGLVQKGEMPLGNNVWKDTLLLLPPNQKYVFTDALTGLQIEAANEIRIGNLFQHFPGSVLVGKVC